MADAIGPGDWVECVSGRAETAFRTGGGSRPLHVGGMYRIRAMTPVRGSDNVVRPGCWLMEIRGSRWTNGLECAFRLDGFRPVYRPKQEIIEALKTPVKLSEDT
jgi:hypothetical protein